MSETVQEAVVATTEAAPEIPEIPDFDNLFGNTILSEEEKQRRSKECGEKVKAILQKYNCTLVPEIHFVPDNEGVLRYVFNIQLAPLPPGQTL